MLWLAFWWCFAVKHDNPAVLWNQICLLQRAVAVYWKSEIGSTSVLLVATLQSSLGLVTEKKSFDPPLYSLCPPLPVEPVNIL